MADPSFTAPIGTRDVLPPESDRWAALVATFADHVGRAGYGLVVGPMFEDLAVFQRVGEATDIVTKEMYDFEDKGGRRIALRPEGTASIVRAYVQHRPVGTPWKAWYAAPNFRYERPQAGRYRQHHQLGIEALGSDDPDLDVEVIALQADLYARLGLRQVDLLVNSMGSPADRAAYAAALGRWLEERRDALDPADRPTIATNPMRVLDSKREATRRVTDDAPTILSSLSADTIARFERVREGLDALGIAHRVEPRLVRGLDYYTHTTFEFQATALASAQNAIGGGGRYDGLAEALGGPATPGIGFGSGIERILLACDAEGVFPGPDGAPGTFVVDVVDGTHARDLVADLRRAGLRADRAYGGRSMKAQMKAADRSGAAWAVIVGADEAEADEVTVRDLRGSREQERVPRDAVIDHLRKRL
ncbi:histidine--tRNA ligase [Actinomarinicola tropica]|uniref:Histidine--tRNA ligase n=1 Tax=Actinomarinicola tropica TaxID=2789776 RepID=A0A5Q2RMP3_9ACTN|nr:histidine--tRNA ligase [Actinomarinicola tropica]QGG95160.1 histidine--tRNA ligase [Actinomarinicola tropica]